MVPLNPELSVRCALLPHPLRLLSPGVPHLHLLLFRTGESVGVAGGQPVLAPAVRVEGPQVEDGGTTQGAEPVGLPHPVFHIFGVQTPKIGPPDVERLRYGTEVGRGLREVPAAQAVVTATELGESFFQEAGPKLVLIPTLEEEELAPDGGQAIIDDDFSPLARHEKPEGERPAVATLRIK
jgi:hypothetical protein